VSDIFREVDEDVRAQEYVRLWKTYGKYVIAGMVAIVVGTAGSVAWRNYTTEKMRAEGDKYAAAKALLDQGKYADSALAFETVGKESGAGYALVARLQAAEALIRAGKTDEAVKAYDAIAADGSYDKVYRDLATLSSVMQQLDTGDPAALKARLETLNTEENAWRFSAQEMLAALALKTGQPDTAKDLFKGLSESATAPAGIRDRAKEMLSAMDTKS
jgi:hypothetical protein